MSLRFVVLTTDTPHHHYYVWKLGSQFPIEAIFLESRLVHPPFETFHPFETERDEFEQGELLSGCDNSYADVAKTCVVDTVNTDGSLSRLRAIAPDVVIVFGTGKLDPAVISIPGVACLNLHGGNPEFYRGLDNHLWAIYHQDFKNLVTTLHHVDPALDTGDIVAQSSLPVTRGCRLFQLRSINARVCVDLSVLALNWLEQGKHLLSRGQVTRGRYYSFMPSVLKEGCVKKFESYTAQL